jgi:hypothetical protein
MTARLRVKVEPTIRDFIDDDHQVIAVHEFHPWMSRRVDRGQYFKLSDEIVRANLQFFAIVIPVDDVIGHAEGGSGRPRRGACRPSPSLGRERPSPKKEGPAAA